MHTTIAERLQIILNQKSLTASAFADEIAVQRSNISHIISGRSKPSLDFIEKMCTRFPDIDVSWFISGKAAAIAHKPAISEKPAQRDLFGQVVNEPQILNSEPIEQIAQNTPSVQQLPERHSIEKKIVKIITFFSDNSFQEFIPEVSNSQNE